MEQLIGEVNQSIASEYNRASQTFGETNHSDHESYAIIREEFDEAMHEIKLVEGRLESFWHLVKSKGSEDGIKSDTLNRIKSAAIFAACECIQVAAMCHKANLTIQRRNEKCSQSE